MLPRPRHSHFVRSWRASIAACNAPRTPTHIPGGEAKSAVKGDRVTRPRPIGKRAGVKAGVGVDSCSDGFYVFSVHGGNRR